jgi:hypothetical protein
VPLLFDRSRFRVALDHDQAAQQRAVFARHFLPGRLARVLATRDSAPLFLWRQQDAPAVFRHLHITELGPALRVN